MRLKQEVEKKWPELINRKNVVIGWVVLMHPPYSPDLVPLDFHLYRSFQNSLGSVRIQRLKIRKSLVSTGLALRRLRSGYQTTNIWIKIEGATVTEIVCGTGVENRCGHGDRSKKSSARPGLRLTSNDIKVEEINSMPMRNCGH
ncbi:hypothetical protein EVAR_64003_1 [Eumeta japonica]|uniref:Histone-lysine N-methyltransferase SETMAR n=1 Tax=Eumeta variegata TaxID=151549 RepID=A0A4C1YYN8_EUMVA|nr:hypothetical protein EVAR_64003_1 [Eumeta japonica]